MNPLRHSQSDGPETGSMDGEQGSGVDRHAKHRIAGKTRNVANDNSPVEFRLAA